MLRETLRGWKARMSCLTSRGIGKSRRYGLLPCDETRILHPVLEYRSHCSIHIGVRLYFLPFCCQAACPKRVMCCNIFLCFTCLFGLLNGRGREGCRGIWGQATSDACRDGTRQHIMLRAAVRRCCLRVAFPPVPADFLHFLSFRSIPCPAMSRAVV